MLQSYDETSFATECWLHLVLAIILLTYKSLDAYKPFKKRCDIDMQFCGKYVIVKHVYII